MAVGSLEEYERFGHECEENNHNYCQLTFSKATILNQFSAPTRKRNMTYHFSNNGSLKPILKGRMVINGMPSQNLLSVIWGKALEVLLPCKLESALKRTPDHF